MRRIAWLCLLPIGLLGAQQSRPPVYRPPQETLPRKLARQPVPFSHKIHNAEGLECQDCHPTARKKLRAGLPRLRDCMNCHQTIGRENPAIQRMAKLYAGGVDKVTWVRAYTTPEYVWFSHKKHVSKSSACTRCHGDVTQHDVLPQEMAVNMTACMNCHAHMGVTIECYICHDLGQ